MAVRNVLFVQGAGAGAHAADAALAASLRDSLGPAYCVDYPRMPEEHGAGYADWKATLEPWLAPSDEPVVLVGHSAGAAVLIKRLAEEPAARPIAGLYLLAAPFFGAAGWDYDELRFPDDVTRLARLPHVALYHSRDDEAVPFAHLALIAARLPFARVVELDGRGHQLAEDLSDIAAELAARASDRRS